MSEVYSGTGPVSGSSSVTAGSMPVGGGSSDSDGSPSLGDIVGEITTDFSKLMRQEIALAKAELTEEAKKAGKGVGMLAGAGYAAHLFVLFLSFALLGLLWAWWDSFALAAFVVALLWGIGAAVLGLRGKKQLKTVNPKPEQTIETLKEDAQWAKHPTR